MRIVVSLMTLTISLVFFMGSALAVPPGKTAEFQGGKLGKVVFDGKKHFDAGLKCNSCHTKLFKMKKGSTKMTMADLNAGKYCGSCHNGEKAFKITDCTKCHKKEQAAPGYD
ncbi:MAG: cytochrome c3 family protein [Nitrospirota bacterium]|nr:cytochrome c3 family protein [Nitrospirota bacterium]